MPRKKNRSVFGRVFKRPGRPGYYVRVRLHGRETTRWAGPDRKTAHEFLGRLLRESAREDLLGEKAVASVTFQEAESAVLRYFKARHAESTYKGEAGRVRWFVRRWRSKTMAEVTVGDVEDALTQLKTEHGASIATRNRYLSALSRAYEFAVNRCWSRANPTAGIKRDKEEKRPVRYVSPADIARLEEEATDPAYRAFIRVLADTGLRSGEARRLEWRDVDLARGKVLVRRSKTKEPREVGLTTAVRDVLVALEARRLPGARPGRDPLWPVLRDLTAGSVSARFRRLARRAGFESMRAHDLRHGFCSRMAQAGIPLPTIGALAGHKSVLTTQRYASHIPDGATSAAIRRLELAEKSAVLPIEGDRTGDQPTERRATA